MNHFQFLEYFALKLGIWVIFPTVTEIYVIQFRIPNPSFQFCHSKIYPIWNAAILVSNSKQFFHWRIRWYRMLIPFQFKVIVLPSLQVISKRIYHSWVPYRLDGFQFEHREWLPIWPPRPLDAHPRSLGYNRKAIKQWDRKQRRSWTGIREIDSWRDRRRERDLTKNNLENINFNVKTVVSMRCKS
jgi:hypothetical protein